MEGKGKWWFIAIAVVLTLSLIGSCNECSTSSGGGNNSSGYRCSNCGGDGRTSWNP